MKVVLRPIVVRPTPTVFHRYRADEMSGPLPPVVYKILPKEYARRLVHEGETMWSTLTWFQNEEDLHRGDESEGARRFFPVSGLEVNRVERDGKPDNANFVLPSHGLVSRAAQSNHIFIYSMTLDPSLTLGESVCECIEVFDPPRFLSRVRDGLKRHRKARPETLIHDVVRYWASSSPPEEVWALPDRLTMHKHRDYEAQREYRLAFGTRANVFDFENVECFVLDNQVRWPRIVLDPQVHRLKLRLGNLEDCCRIRNGR
jgi:hypothetical protein